MYLLIAFIGYFCLAVVAILDKFIVSSRTSRPLIYTFYSTIFMLPILLAQFLVGWPFQGLDLVWGLVSGLTFGFGLWTLYLAVYEGEASHINPFNGGMITLATLLLSTTFLGEKLNSIQVLGIVILSLACFILSFEKSKNHQGFHRGFIWAIISAVFFAISHVATKYLYNGYEFWPAFVWSRGSTGFLGLLLLLMPSVRRSLFLPKSANKVKKERKLFIIFSNKFLGVVGVILVQYAIAIGSVVLVNALAGLEYAFIFVLIYLSTKLTPKFFKEYFTKRELVMEVLAIILVIIGSALFVL